MIPFKTSSGDRNLALEYEADVLFWFTKTNWQPFGVIGLGLYQNVMGDHGKDVDFQWHYGFGVRGFVARRLALRFEARHVMTDTTVQARGLASNIEILVGLNVLAWRDEPEPPKDRDKDGILDVDDLCPDTPGLKELQGCPDRDRDGITDAEDRCPDDQGPRETKGCPDTDGDTLVDIDDQCPKEKGPVALKGCPPSFDGVLEGITFELNSAKIRPEAIPVLEAVAEQLTKFPKIRVRIHGHTDDRNTDAYNLKLSQRRAASVRQWLIDHGIAGSRMEVKGFGESKHLTSNDTEEGRAKNRRIEFHVVDK